MIITILIALALHGGILMWLELRTPVPFTEPPAQPLLVSLLSVVGEITTPPAISEPPPEPIPEPEPAPVAPPPKPVPEPVLQEVLPKEPPPVKPMPEAEPQPVKSVPEPVQTPEPIQEIALPPPMKSGTVSLDAAAIAQYEQLLRAWLEKHKIYPRHAKRLRIEGEGMLRILIDRTGRIQRAVLEKRTGNRLLDQAALKMARRADPFPPIPENDLRRELEFIVPVVFALR